MRSIVPCVLCALVAAQELKAGVQVHDDCAGGKIPWLIRAQAEDGHWPAAGPDGGRPVRDLRATALAMLGILADGSTLQSGPFRAQLRKACHWLRQNQDGQGRFALHTEPDWLLDHAMATYAVLEAARLGKETPSAGQSSAIDALTVGLRHQRGRDVAVELLLWSEMCARSAAALQADEEWAAHLLALRREIERLRARRDIPEALHERAALLLLEVIEGRGAPARRLELAEPFLQPAWPAKTTDPRAMLYYSMACFRLAGTDRAFSQAWKHHSRRLTEVVVRTHIANGDTRGTWDPVGSFGQDGGRMCTTATHVLILTVYYRYCRLSIVTK